MPIPRGRTGALARAVTLLRRLSVDAPANGTSHPHPAIYWGGIADIRRFLNSLPAEGS